ncbi:MAG: hypothetical protein QM758_00495 [Armatimonas sp.]
MQIARILAGVSASVQLMCFFHQTTVEGKLLSLMACIGSLFVVYLCKPTTNRLS